MNCGNVNVVTSIEMTKYEVCNVFKYVCLTECINLAEVLFKLIIR